MRIILGIAISALLSTPAIAEFKFSVTDLADLTKMAYLDFQQLEPTLAEKVYAFSSNLQGDDAIVRLIYKDEEGTTKRVTFLCHEHGTTECHLQ